MSILSKFNIFAHVKERERERERERQRETERDIERVQPQPQIMPELCLTVPHPIFFIIMIITSFFSVGTKNICNQYFHDF